MAMSYEDAHPVRAVNIGCAGQRDGAGGVSSRPFHSAIFSDGLRSLARSSAERNLIVRFELSGFQRGVKALRIVEHPASPASAFLFANALGGVKFGMSEGAALRADGTDLTAWAHDIAAASGCNLLSLARATEGELPDGASQRVEGHSVFAKRTVTHVRMRMREVLRLAPGYEDTLAELGRHTRRNMRHARKLAAAEGITFVLAEGARSVPGEALAALAQQTDPAPISLRRMRVFEAFADHSTRPFRSVLRDANGNLVSYCCGFLGQGVAYLIYQLNNRALNRLGPSLMHRSFLIEALVERGCRELVFVHGCSGVLRHACVPMVADHYWVMRRNAASRLSAAALARLQPNILLGKLARAALDAG